MAIATLSQTFVTEHLGARPVTRNDRDALAETLNNPDFLEGFRRNAAPDTQIFADKAAHGWQEGLYFTFVLSERPIEQVIGFVAIRPDLFAFDGVLGADVEIALAPQVYGQGFAYEAMCGLFRWSFDAIRYPTGNGLDEIRAACVLSNTRSLRLLARLGAVGMRDLGEQQLSVQSLNLWQDLLSGSQPQVTGHGFKITRQDHQSANQSS